MKEYIIPPKGHTFIGFKFEPLHNNQIYDGKLVAQYEKSTIKERLSSNIWKMLIPVIIVVILGLVILLGVSVFKTPKTPKTDPKKPDKVMVEPQKDSLEEPIIDNFDNIQEQPTTPPDATSDNQASNELTQSEPEESGVILDLTESINQQQEDQNVETETQTPQPVVDDANLQFKKEFWTLIHQCTVMMDPYDALFKEYKNKVKGEEYDYLRFTILKDYANFKAWSDKLKKIPEGQLQSIESIDVLINRMNKTS